MPKKKNPDLALGSSLSFYNGKINLQFSQRDHIYYRVLANGSLEPQDGVTHACGILDKSMYLIPWACKVMALKIFQSMPREKDALGNTSILPLDWEEFETLITESKKAHKEHLDDAADVGASAHVWLEDSIRWAIAYNNGVVEKLTDQIPTDERAINCGKAALDWMREHKVKFIKTESIVYSQKHQYAGTLDGLAEVDGILSIVDWKSSNALRTEYCFQTAAYLRAYEEEYGITIPDRWILRLGKEDGKFEPWHLEPETIEEDFYAFILCLTLKRVRASIEYRIKENKSKLKSKKAETNTNAENT